jgi:hypothetical protein
MGLRYLSVSGVPICYESAEVSLVDGVREISYAGSLSAVLVPAVSDHGCQYLGLIFDEKSTLIVDCLHGEAAIQAFRDTCAANNISMVTELTRSIMTPCPPPPNQRQVEAWSARLFTELCPGRSS